MEQKSRAAYRSAFPHGNAFLYAAFYLLSAFIPEPISIMSRSKAKAV